MSYGAGKEGWEREDFPILCGTCMGDNPFVRMQKTAYGAECKICTRPFTVFRWRAGTDGRYKKTEICLTCAKMKNVCQTCILDLEFALPVQVRDATLPDSVVAARPQSQVGVIYNAQLAERQVAGGALPYDRADYGAVVQKLARTQPYYQRNKAHICSFWVQGKCTRGDVCPYRHEMPTHDPKSDMAKQNIRDRYWGQDDPVAKKMLAKAQAHERPEAPEEVKSVFVGKVTADIKEEDIKDHFYSFGNVVNIRMVPTQTCAFIEYSSHDEAKKAIDSLQGKLIVKGQLLRVSWAKPQTAGEPSNGPPQDLAMPNFAPPAPGQGWGGYYPSMDPRRLGTAPSGGPGMPPQGFPGGYPGQPYYPYPYGIPPPGQHIIQPAPTQASNQPAHMIPRQTKKVQEKAAAAAGDEPSAGARVKRGADEGDVDASAKKPKSTQ